MQIRGRKQVHVFDGTDRSLLSEEELERFHGGAHCNLVYREAYAPKARTFELTPGLGLHIPLTAPHWVQNGRQSALRDGVKSLVARVARRYTASRRSARLRK